MTERTSASWLVYVLGALCTGAIVAAILLVGPASSSTATIARTAKVAHGVVQSTVSGSGNLQAASQLNLGFKTSGTVTHIYVVQGQHVTQGQLIATLDPQSAEVTLEQAKASLQSAAANLAKEQETDGEGSTAGGSNGSATGNASPASAAAAHTSEAHATNAANAPTQTTSTVTTSPSSTVPATGTSTSTAPATTPANTTPAATTPAARIPSATTAPSKRSTSTTTGPSGKGATTTSEGEGKQSSSAAGSSKSTIGTATREANLASAKAAVRSDTLTVQSDEQAVQDTRLYAPESGTIVSLSGQEGEVVSGSGTTRASSTASSSGGSTPSSAGATGRSATSSSASSSSSDSSSSSFAVLSDLSSMQLVVALSESEIGSVEVGQIATVTVEALNGSKLAAHVREVALLSTSSSGAVSYDVTFQLDQLAAGLKIGMSATAEVVVKQAEGVNVPTSAISAEEVTVERGGKQVRRRVVTGLAGNTSTIVLSGLKAGETVVLPAASTTSSSTTNVLSRLGSRLGGAGIGGAGAFGGAGGAGGGAFFRGGG